MSGNAQVVRSVFTAALIALASVPAAAADKLNGDQIRAAISGNTVQGTMEGSGAYAEFVFTPVLWPDFTKAELAAAVEVFSKRERRFGQTSEQVRPTTPA